MTRVLALVTFKVFPPQMGGQKGVVLFYKHLKGFLAICMAVSKNNAPPPTGWDVQPVLFDNRKMFQNPFVFKKLKKLIREKKIQVIVAEHSYAGWMALVLKKMFQIPFVIHSHNIEARRFQQMGRPGWQAYHAYEKWIHQKADHNFFISKEDEAYALQHFRLQSAKCSVITYGVEQTLVTVAQVKQLKEKLGLTESETIFYFNGTLDYKPNVDAVQVMINHILPMLQKDLPSFKIIITGNRAPHALEQQLKGTKNILYLGFVEDIQPYYAMAHVFLNPVQNNSGIKTKVVEAIAAGCTVISTESGAAGLNHKVCGDKLRLVKDGDWATMVQLALQAAKQPNAPTPKAFYDSYLWNNIAQQAALQIEAVARQYAH